jgi:two-component system chemotaxis response regulator CheY
MKETLNALIIDDMRTAREEIIAFLKEYIPGVKIYEAEDGLEGYAIIQKNKNVIDVVFTDINMPNVNGLKLIKILREVEGCKDLPIIVVSIMNETSDIEKALALGANGYITKPTKKGDFEIIYTAIIEPLLKKN